MIFHWLQASLFLEILFKYWRYKLWDSNEPTWAHLDLWQRRWQNGIEGVKFFLRMYLWERKPERGGKGRVGIRRQYKSEPSESTGEETKWKLPRPLFGLLKVWQDPGKLSSLSWPAKELWSPRSLGTGDLGFHCTKSLLEGRLGLRHKCGSVSGQQLAPKVSSVSGL